MSCRYRVIFARHGESEWNNLNRFCGWYDAPLCEDGVHEALSIAEKLKSYEFDVVFTSLLKRSYDSANIVLKALCRPCIPIRKSWQLNERHYGALTGFNKAETAEKYGLEQTQVWRRSFDVLPPPMTKDHQYYKEIVSNPVFAEYGIREEDIPLTESLKTVMLRCVPFWDESIVPEIKSGQRVLIIAHGTSLRAIIKHIDNISDEEITETNVPTGIPFIYEFDRNMKVLISRNYLENEETVRKKIEKVAGIGKK